jgi:molecular chaperone HscB
MSVKPGKNFFELFGLPVTFDVDSAQLAARYRDVQREVHPDKFAAAPGAERRVSMQLTALVNEGYQTLKDPVRRARYLLELDGVSVDTDSDTRMAPQFLLEQMELREALAEARELGEPHKRLAELSNMAELKMKEKTDAFRSAYEAGEAGRNEARTRFREMQFLARLSREIEDLEEELA